MNPKDQDIRDTVVVKAHESHWFLAFGSWSVFIPQDCVGSSGSSLDDFSLIRECQKSCSAGWGFRRLDFIELDPKWTVKRILAEKLRNQLFDRKNINFCSNISIWQSGKFLSDAISPSNWRQLYLPPRFPRKIEKIYFFQLFFEKYFRPNATSNYPEKIQFATSKIVSADRLSWIYARCWLAEGIPTVSSSREGCWGFRSWGCPGTKGGCATQSYCCSQISENRSDSVL